MIPQTPAPTPQPKPQYGEQTTRGVVPREEARWLFDYTLLVEFIRARIAGGRLMQIPATGELKIMKPTYPFMNKKGVEATISIISGFVTGKIQATANFDRKEVYRWCRELWLSLAKHYAKNMHKYELKKDGATLVIRMIVNLFHANLSKSINAEMINVIRGTERVTVTEGQEKKKRFWIW